MIRCSRRPLAITRTLRWSSLVLLLAALSGCRTYSVTLEMADFHETTRRADAALELLSEAYAIERGRSFLRTQLANPMPYHEAHPETLLGFQNEGCVGRNLARIEALNDTLQEAGILGEMERCAEGSDAACAALGPLREVTRLAPDPQGEGARWDCSLKVFSTRMEEGESVADRPIPGAGERDLEISIVRQVRETSGLISEFAGQLRALSGDTSAREINASLRRATFPLKVGIATYEEEPSRELSTIDGGTGLLMQGFDSVFQLVRNAKVRTLVREGHEGVAEAGREISWRVAVVHTTLEQRLVNRLIEAKDDLDFIRAGICSWPPPEPIVNTCGENYERRLAAAFEAFENAREAVVAAEEIRLTEVFEAYAGAMSNLRTLSRRLNGPSPLFHKQDYQEHQQAQRSLRTLKEQADRSYEAVARLRSIVSRAPTRSVLPREEGIHAKHSLE